jgi:hypothetical protein
MLAVYMVKCWIFSGILSGILHGNNWGVNDLKWDRNGNN